MTEEQEALVEALRLFAADQGIGFDRMHDQMAAGLIEPIGEDLCDSTFSVTPAGALVLALAAERDLWRLRCEWQEARAESFAAQLEYAELNPDESRENVSLEVLDEADDRMMLAAEKRDAARAAYLAAGGEE